MLQFMAVCMYACNKRSTGSALVSGGHFLYAV